MVEHTYHHVALRETILAEAFRVLETDGIEALSLRKVAVAAGVSKTAPYRHFKDKRDLLVTLAAEGFRLFADVLEAALEASLMPDVQPLERNAAVAGIRALIRAYLVFARSRPALYRLMFSRRGFSLHSESCRLHSQRAIGTLFKAAAAAQAAGWRQGQEGRALALSIWAGAHGWAGFLIEDLLPEGVEVLDEEVARFTEIFLS